jgi:signal transduction histidine kinase
MRIPLPTNLRTRLTLWYVAVLAVLLLVYAGLVFVFQYAVLTRQLAHDELQDVVTAEGLLYFDSHGALRLHEDYFSHPQSHLLIDRLMEVRDLSGNVLYRSSTLHGMSLGGPNLTGDGLRGFDERITRLQDGTPVYFISHIHTMHGRILLIRLGYSLTPLRRRMVQFLLLLILAIPLALALAGAAGQLIARRALRPLDRMTARAASITAHNLSDRLDIQNPKDELGQMAKVFNHLLDRLEQAFLQLQRFTADAAHELRTPLASLRTIGEVSLQSDQGEEAYREALGSILEETSRLNETIESLLLLSKAETTQPGSEHTVFVMADLVNEVLNLLEIVIEEKHITVLQENESAGHVYVRANRTLLRVAILNVVHNALKFSPNGSILRISYSRPERPGTKLLLTIQDEGPGIKPSEHEKVFDRFFTSSSSATASHSGAGLGLSIAKLIIDRTGGNIEFDDTVQEGARCTIELSVHAQP